MVSVKAITGFEDKYAVDAVGTVYSIQRLDSMGRCQGGGILKPRLDRYGYMRVGLSNINRRTTYRTLHRLVAQAFISNPNNLPCVNHKDGNKLNNSVDNLEWCSWKTNVQHAWNNGLCRAYDRTQPYNRMGIQDSNRKRRKYTLTEALITKIFNLRAEGVTQQKIGDIVGIKQGTISQILTGKLGICGI